MQCSDITIDGDFDGGSTDGQFSLTVNSDAYENVVHPPGQYMIAITGTAVGSNPLNSDVAFFFLTLVDPCDPPVSITAPTLVNQEYTLTEIGVTYTL